MSENEMNAQTSIQAAPAPIRRTKVYGGIDNFKKLVDSQGRPASAQMLGISVSSVTEYLNTGKCPPTVEMAAEFLLQTAPFEAPKPMPIYVIRPENEEQRLKIETALGLINVVPMKLGEV
jgi:hypothetical protein